jgi:uncharacterized membrane protein
MGRSLVNNELLELLFIFLSRDDREILDYLVKNQGRANQADRSKLQGMSRVKAFRSVQRMKENNLVEVKSYGKVRSIQLKKDVFDMLLNHKE